MADLRISNVFLDRSHESVDIVIREGRITSVGPPPAEWKGKTIDGQGRLALPGLVDGHAHLDNSG